MIDSPLQLIWYFVGYLQAMKDNHHFSRRQIYTTLSTTLPVFGFVCFSMCNLMMDILAWIIIFNNNSQS